MIDSAPAMSPEELRVAGFKALTRALGTAAALRFVLQYEHGRGDYSRERHDLIDNLATEQVEQLVMQAGQNTPSRPSGRVVRQRATGRRSKRG